MSPTYRKIGKTPCTASCPSDDGGCLDGEIDEEGEISYSWYDRERCTTRAMNFGINSFQKAMAEIVTEDDPETRTNMINSDFFNRSCSAVSFFRESVAQCFECMRVCPITAPGEKTEMSAAAGELDLNVCRKELDALSRKGGAVITGVADATAFTDAPEGQRPTDLLPKARSVYVVGGAQPRAGDWQSPIYQHMETTSFGDRMHNLAQRLSRYIEDEYGYYAICVPARYGQW